MSTNTQQAVIAVLLSDAGIYVDAFCGEQEAKAHIVSALSAHKTPTYAQYQEWRETWKTATEGRSAGARNTAWSRLIADAGVTIPASENPDAEKKAAKRDEERARLDSMALEELEKCVQEAAARKAYKEADKYQAAIKRQADALLKPELDARKDEAKTIKALVTDKLTLDQLKAIHEAIEKIIK